MDIDISNSIYIYYIGLPTIMYNFVRVKLKLKIIHFHSALESSIVLRDYDDAGDYSMAHYQFY